MSAHREPLLQVYAYLCAPRGTRRVIDLKLGCADIEAALARQPGSFTVLLQDVAAVLRDASMLPSCLTALEDHVQQGKQATLRGEAAPGAAPSPGLARHLHSRCNPDAWRLLHGLAHHSQEFSLQL